MAILLETSDAILLEDGEELWLEDDILVAENADAITCSIRTGPRIMSFLAGGPTITTVTIVKPMIQNV